MTQDKMIMTEADARRFIRKIDVRGDDECWPWLVPKHSQGYGRFRRRSLESSNIRWDLI